MYSLTGLGVGLAYLFSAVAVFAPGVFPEVFRQHGAVGTYFEAAAVIVTFGDPRRPPPGASDGPDEPGGK